MGYRLLILKRWVEDILMLPFIWYGRRQAARHPWKMEYDIVFFFPFYHIGGAEKVHAHIVQALKDEKALIVFTRTSANEGFLTAFNAAGHEVVDISRFTDNKYRYWTNLWYRGFYSGLINRQKKRIVVFNGHSNFAYKLSRWIRKDIPQIELIHSFSSFSYIRLPFLPFYRTTVMISRNRIRDHIDQYRAWGVPGKFDERIEYILNGITLPEQQQHRFEEGRLRLLYVGRSTAEKRVHLADGIYQQLKQSSLPVTMTYVGDVSAVVAPGNGEQLGNITNEQKLDTVYRRSDILLVTSSEEGFPMVVMEAMARGCVILATPVGDLPVHVKDNENGYLFSETANEQKIIDEARNIIEKLLHSPELCRRLSANNINYAYANFGLTKFEARYRELIESCLH
jgi:glycosyltransferase involved in cell wall biosynthesis